MIKQILKSLTHSKTQVPRYQCFLRTSDDFYPSYYIENGMKEMIVEAGFFQLIDGRWRVCVWGADDCGYEKDFSEKECQDAFLLFLKLLKKNKPDDVLTKRFLENEGFVHA